MYISVPSTATTEARLNNTFMARAYVQQLQIPGGCGETEVAGLVTSAVGVTDHGLSTHYGRGECA